MQVHVQQADLKNALQAVKVAADAARRSIPVLGNVLVEAGEAGLRLAATDLEVAVAACIEANVEQPGAITAPAEALAELVGTFPPARVTLKVGERKSGKEATPTLAVACDGSQATFNGIDAEQFPLLPTPRGEPLRVPTAIFKRMVRQVAFAAARQDEDNAALTGILVQFEAGHLAMAATDKYRLAVNLRDGGFVPWSSQDERPPDTSFVIPPKALEIAAQHAEEDGGVEVYELNDCQVLLCAGGVEIVAQRLQNTFPDYPHIIPKSWATRTVVDRAALLAACRQAAPFARDSGHAVHLQIQPANGAEANLSVSARGQETGDLETKLEAEIEGEPAKIKLNVRYLVDALTVVETERVALETTAPNKAGVLRPVGDDAYVYTVMPLS